MRAQRRIIFTCLAICIISLALFLSDLPPAPLLSAPDANDLLLGIFNGALVAIPIAHIEYRERLHELDQRFFPCAGDLLNIVAEVYEIPDSKTLTNDLMLTYLESIESNRFREALMTKESARSKDSMSVLKDLFPDSNQADIEAMMLQAVTRKISELSRSSWAYVKLRDFRYDKLISLGGSYCYTLCGLSRRQRLVNSFIAQTKAIQKKVNHDARDIGVMRIFSECNFEQVLREFKDVESIVDYARDHDCLLSATLRSAVSLQGAWIKPARADRQHERNPVAVALFQTFSALVRKSSWLEKGKVPLEPWW